MVNEYGVQLDRNGYAPSILPTEGCANCKRETDLVRHEIFHGSLRQKSKAYGLWVTLCPACHMKLHDNAAMDRGLKKVGETAAILHYDWSVKDFRDRFFKNYIEVDDE